MLLSIKETAEKLGYKSNVSVLRLVKSGKLKAVRLNQRTIRIDPEELQKYINSKGEVI